MKAMEKANSERIVVFDTETTGMNFSGAPHEGHRVIEIGAVEIINRKLTDKQFHVYLKPDRSVDPQAFKVHGLSDEFLADKPTYAQIHQQFFDFINGAHLVAHNAPFDIGFINQEFTLFDPTFAKLEQFCQITDTLVLAKKLFPGKRNNLDLLCERYGIDNSHRTLHGALLDAQILADVYLMMTGGQTSLQLSSSPQNEQQFTQKTQQYGQIAQKLKIVKATQTEQHAHEAWLEKLAKGGHCLWRTQKE
ncbi:MAG: DNA polymerase III subunit epsilon [Enterovibrio sp.]